MIEPIAELSFQTCWETAWIYILEDFGKVCNSKPMLPKVNKKNIIILLMQFYFCEVRMLYKFDGYLIIRYFS